MLKGASTKLNIILRISIIIRVLFIIIIVIKIIIATLLITLVAIAAVSVIKLIINRKNTVVLRMPKREMTSYKRSMQIE